MSICMRISMEFFGGFGRDGLELFGIWVSEAEIEFVLWGRKEDIYFMKSKSHSFNSISLNNQLAKISWKSNEFLDDLNPPSYFFFFNLQRESISVNSLPCFTNLHDRLVSFCYFLLLDTAESYFLLNSMVSLLRTYF